MKTFFKAAKLRLTDVSTHFDVVNVSEQVDKYRTAYNYNDGVVFTII